MNTAQSKSMPNLGIWFPAREGGKPTAFALPIALTGLMDGVEVFDPDWNDIEENLTSYIDAWKEATGN